MPSGVVSARTKLGRLAERYRCATVASHSVVMATAETRTGTTVRRLRRGTESAASAQISMIGVSWWEAMIAASTTRTSPNRTGIQPPGGSRPGGGSEPRSGWAPPGSAPAGGARPGS